MQGHVAVLLDEVLRGLAVVPDGRYVDATYGRGGHSRAILRALGPQGRVLALDRDPDAVRDGLELARADARFVIEQERFGRLRRSVESHGWKDGVEGVLFDVGVASPQLDDPARGFSFQAVGPLDMRMDPASAPSAAEWLNGAEEQEIAGVLLRLGEERAARAIARAICARRPLVTTADLAAAVAAVVSRRRDGKHPATRVFQAVRIFINRELEELEAGLSQALGLLKAGGRLCVISFHSLEDRIAKRFMRDHSRVSPELAALPMVPAALRPSLRLIGRAMRPGAAEVSRNPRARSAVLRVAEKLP